MDANAIEPFDLDIVSPEGRTFSGPCESLLVRSVAGEIEILPRHEPLLAVLAPGAVTARRPGGSDETVCAITGGFLHVTPWSVVLLADGVRSPAPDR